MEDFQITWAMKNKGPWLLRVYGGWNATQVCGDFNKPSQGSLLNNQYPLNRTFFRGRFWSRQNPKKKKHGESAVSPSPRYCLWTPWCFSKNSGCGGSFTKKNRALLNDLRFVEAFLCGVGHYTPENSMSVSPNGKNGQPPDRSAVSKHQVSTCWSTCTEPLERGGDFRKRTRAKRSAAG